MKLMVRSTRWIDYASGPDWAAWWIKLICLCAESAVVYRPIRSTKNRCGRPQNKSTRHSTRKRAREAAAHAHNGRKRPQPPKNPPPNATPEQLKSGEKNGVGTINNKNIVILNLIQTHRIQSLIIMKVKSLIFHVREMGEI